MAAYTDAGKMYTLIKGFALGAHLEQTLQALTYSRRMHEGQVRKSGEPYIIHPLTMVSHAISLGIHDDIVLAALLLHDVVEDCDVRLKDLPVNDEVRGVIYFLTFDSVDYEEKKAQMALHYKNMRTDKRACLCKLFDRCHNVSSMAGTFTKEKLQDYIMETHEYVLPLYRFLKDEYPEYDQQLFALKYHIISVTEAISATMETYK